MHITAEITMMRQLRADSAGQTWGFVPTMGYLHQGHIALVHRARAENDWVAASIFVNPLQFAPTEDLSSYPRNLQRDVEMLVDAGVDVLFTPNDALMYPPGFQTQVMVTAVSQPLEGASRPTHFQGVATVVAKLFNIVQPTRAYFGQKDAQQTLVLRQMVRDLNFNLELIVCPTVREADGLAMSSRNAYLSPEQRHAAPVLYRALSQAQTAYTQGERNAATLRQLCQHAIATEPLARLDYISVADPSSLAELEQVGPAGALVSTAVYFGKTRLIDNVILGD